MSYSSPNCNSSFIFFFIQDESLVTYNSGETMYTLDKNGRPRLDGKYVKADTIPKSKRFSTPAGPCVVVAKNMEERVALANATQPEDLEGYKEALQEM